MSTIRPSTRVPTQEDYRSIMADHRRVMRGELDANTMDHQGRSLLGRIGYYYESLAAGDDASLIVDLISRGGMMIGNDQPLAFLLEPGDTATQRLVLSKTLEAMSDAGLENPLHLMAAKAPKLINRMHVGGSVRPDWWGQQDEQGNTVGHHLWGLNSILATQARISADFDAKHPDADENSPGNDLALAWVNTLRECWSVQETTNKIGMGMDTPNMTGQTAMDLCIDRIKSEEATCLSGNKWPVCEQVRREMERREMEEATPMAAGAGRGMRL